MEFLDERLADRVMLCRPMYVRNSPLVHEHRLQDGVVVADCREIERRRKKLGDSAKKHAETGLARTHSMPAIFHASLHPYLEVM